MPISRQDLEQKLLPRVFTARTTFEEVLHIFAEQAEEERDAYYAVVRVGQDRFTVITYAAMARIQREQGSLVLQRPLGGIPELRLQDLAMEPVSLEDADLEQIHAGMEQQQDVSRRHLVVLDAAGDIAGVLPGTRFRPQPAAFPMEGTPAVLGPGPADAIPKSLTPPAQPHLNTRFDGLQDKEPLTVGRMVPLVIQVGAPTASNSAQSSRPFAFTFPDDDTPVTFTVNVDADPEYWSVMTVKPAMIVAPPGQTTQEALFLVSALKPGRDKLHISVERADTGATVQHVWLPVVAAAEGVGAAMPSTPASERTVISMPFHTTQVQRKRVELTITSSTEGFKAMVRADLPRGQVRETYRVPVSGEQIQGATFRLRQELEKIVFYKVTEGRQESYPFANRETFTVDEKLARQAMVDLADVGQQFWNLLFQHPRAPEGLKQLASDIRELPHGSTIQVVIESQQFIVPWALLYDRPGRITPETLDWSGFWGYRYLLDILPPGRYPSPHITESPLNVQLLFNDDANLRSYTTAQEQFVQEQMPDAHTTVVRGTGEVEQELTAPGDGSLVYLYCHGKQVSGAAALGALASESAIFFSGETGTRLADLRRLPAAPFQNEPLVFLNACEGGAQDAFFYDGFMPFFVEELGARGFIGTEVAAPQLLAHDVALKFLDGFARGQSVGEILWNLRRSYLDEHHNILAFNYTLYCLGEVRLSEPLVTEQTS